LKQKYSAKILIKVMKQIKGMADGGHAGAFRCAVQALLLPKEHCDSTAHGILRDTLEWFKDAPGITIEEDEPMEEDDHEEGECTTGNDTDISMGSSMSSKKAKDKKMLKLPALTKMSYDELASGEYSDNKEMLEFRDLLKYDYYEDDDWLWLNNKKRVNLRDIVAEFDNEKFDVETVLRALEVSSSAQPYNVYTKDRMKNYPDVKQIEESHYEKLTVMYNKGELKVATQVQSIELMLKNYLDANRRLASLKNDEPPLFQAVSRSFQPLALKYYKEVYNNGLVCQKNWADLSSLVAQEYVDCWLISNFDYPSLVKPFMDLERNGTKVHAKKKKLKDIYENLLDGLVDQHQAMPPAVKLHLFVKGTMYDLEEISCQDI